jgi:hypothetical protein
MKEVVKSSRFTDVGDLNNGELFLSVFAVKKALKPGYFGDISSRPGDQVPFSEQLVGNMAANEATNASDQNPRAGQQNGIVDRGHGYRF